MYVIHATVISKRKRKSWTDFNILVKGTYKSINNIGFSRDKNTTLSIRTKYLNCKCPHLRLGKSYLLLGKISKDSRREEDKKKQQQQEQKSSESSNTQSKNPAFMSSPTADSSSSSSHSIRQPRSPDENLNSPNLIIETSTNVRKSRNKYEKNSTDFKLVRYIKTSRNTIAIPWKNTYKRKLRRIVKKVKKENRCKTF